MPDQIITREITTRNYSVRADSYTEETRSVEAVLATENPVRVFDWRQRVVVREVLVIDHARMPNQVPMLNSHNRWRVEDQLGSTRDIRVEDGPNGRQVVGRRYFSSVKEADDALTKVREGHLTDGSIGYRVRGYKDLKRGESMDIGGRSFANEEDEILRLSYDWDIIEDSITPIGADQAAKFRSLDQGLPTTIQRSSGETMEQENKAAATESATVTGDSAQRSAPSSTAPVDAAAIERARVAAIMDLGGSDAPADLIRKAISEGWTTERASVEILRNVRASMSAPARTSGHHETADDLCRALEDAVAIRGTAEIPQDADNRNARVREAQRFASVGFGDMARQILSARGMPIPADREDMIRSAISTGNLTNVLGSAARRVLQQGYDVSMPAVLQVAGEEEVSDFRAHTAIQYSAFASLERVGADGRAKLASHTDKGETMSVETYARQLNITRQQWINDDVGAFVRIPLHMGYAAAQNLDTLFYAQLALNSGMGPTMAEDSTAMFADRTVGDNLTATALGDDGLAAAKALLRKQKGLNGEYLNIMPYALLVPPELENTAQKLMNSTELFQTAVAALAGTFNPHRGMAKVVVMPHLSGLDTTAWYLFGNPMQAPAFSVVYLRGQRSPTIKSLPVASDLVLSWEVYHDAGVAATDYRGAVLGTGGD